MTALVRTSCVLAFITWTGGCGSDAASQMPASAPVAAAGLLAEPDATTPALSENVLAVLRLAEANVGEQVMVAFIESSASPFDLSAGDIIYLNDIGIDAPVITAMLERDTTLRDQRLQTGILPEGTNAAPTESVVSEPTTNAVPAAAIQPVYVSDAPIEVRYFYDALDPYGTWIYLSDLGWCWQPRVVVIDRYWRPYWNRGHWIYSDLGWYWRSDYTWGWAAFHYGRWHRHPRQGWVWFPDRVWAPAWVSWRFHDAYCGWAPLPLRARFEPGRGWRFNGVSVGIGFNFDLGVDLFTFVELGHLDERHPHLHGIPPDRVREFFNRTTVVNDYGVGRDNTIINRGIAPERFAAAAHRTVHPVPVRELPPASATVVQAERLAVGGNRSEISRRELRLPERPIATRAQRIDESHPVVLPRPVQALPRKIQQTPPAPAPSRRTSPITAPPSSRTPGVVVSPPRSAPSSRAPVRPPDTSGSLRQPVPVPGYGPTSRGPVVTPPRRPTQPVSPTPPSRRESPRGREQRNSNGTPMQRSPSAGVNSPRVPVPAAPPGQPNPRTGGSRRP